MTKSEAGMEDMVGNDYTPSKTGASTQIIILEDRVEIANALMQGIRYAKRKDKAPFMEGEGYEFETFHDLDSLKGYLRETVQLLQGEQATSIAMDRVMILDRGIGPSDAHQRHSTAELEAYREHGLHLDEPFDIFDRVSMIFRYSGQNQPSLATDIEYQAWLGRCKAADGTFPAVLDFPKTSNTDGDARQLWTLARVADDAVRELGMEIARKHLCGVATEAQYNPARFFRQPAIKNLPFVDIYGVK